MIDENVIEPILVDANAKKWGRFQLVSLLGAGGMGDVYKAYDPNLKRFIALKILRHDDPETLQRFLREARAQAQVEHRHVCKIYESGECEGHPYIAMQFLDGRTLKELNTQLTLEDKLIIIKEVALGLHAAHRQGLIHRDIKPSNIMVTQTDEGEWKPFIMDFGIAREQAAPGLTSTGMVVGTPFYMSPEHARGKLESVDHRSDIYSLGVALYELLSGHVPFQGETPVEVLIQVIENDPLSLRKLNPRVPYDVETIVMKCLEKDPNRRYNSAKELSEDIQRYLDGDPIKARPTTVSYRIKRKIIKYKFSSIAIGSASLVIIILLALWFHTQWVSSKRALVAQELGQEVEKIESTIRFAHRLRLHNISQEKNQIRGYIKTIEDIMSRAGSMSLGPGHYAIGRGYMALQDYEKARYHLERAWEAKYQDDHVAFELGRALGELYLLDSEKVDRIENKGLHTARAKEIETTFREPAVQYLEKVKEIPDKSLDYITALSEFYKKNYQKALQQLQTAMENANTDAPWLYEAKILEGNIYLTIGREKTNYEEAMNYFPRAEQAYQQVIRSGESDIRGYMGLCRVLERKIMIMLQSKGGDLLPLVNEAIAQCEKALQIDPEQTDIYVMISSIYRWLGRCQLFAGQNPIEAFNRSIDSTQKALILAPENYEAYTIAGITHQYLAEYQAEHGKDPTGAFQMAAWNFNKAIEFNPTYVMAYNGMGNVYIRRAEYEMNHGQDPDNALEKAISTFKKALSINPQLLALHNGLAGALWLQGGRMATRGQDPRPTFLDAVKSLENALAINPSVVHFSSNLGFVYLDMGRYELNYGFIPTTSLNKALEYFEKALKINPGANELYVGLVSVTGSQAQYDYLKGQDCSKHVSQADTYFKRGLEQNPNAHLLYIRLAEIYIIQAHYLLGIHQSPSDLLSLADSLINKAKALNPNYYENYSLEGESWLLKARWRLEKKQDTVSYFKLADNALKIAKRLNPKSIESHLINARLNWRRAEEKIAQYQTPAALKYIEEGLTCLQDLLAINPNYAEAYALRGVLLRVRATIPTNRNRLSDKKESRQLLLKAIRIDQNLKTHYNAFLQE